ncbi:hypothetical protein LCGC14_0919790 [marine sediment metagenome]|uniref:Uncharacterized protein n=1 Tax=marine sediment metagenome TaxID=412755 RepID=A0A0F9NVX7_9ZZZZ
MVDKDNDFDKIAFELQYEKWIASQITDEAFYDYINENGISMQKVLDLATERRLRSEAKPPDVDGRKEQGDLVTPPPGGDPMQLEQCLRCFTPVVQFQAVMGQTPFIWVHIDSDHDLDHLPKVLEPMAVNVIHSLVEACDPVVVKNATFKWDTLAQAERYRVLHMARSETNPDYLPEPKVPEHAEDLRRALDATGGPIEQD